MNVVAFLDTIECMDQWTRIKTQQAVGSATARRYGGARRPRPTRVTHIVARPILGGLHREYSLEKKAV
jgi:hypothetical protein